MTSEGLRFTDADGSRRLDTAIAAVTGGLSLVAYRPAGSP